MEKFGVKIECFEDTDPKKIEGLPLAFIKAVAQGEARAAEELSPTQNNDARGPAPK